MNLSILVTDRLGIRACLPPYDAVEHIESFVI